MNSHLKLNHLHKSFGNVQAVKDVDLQIKRGELVSLLGPSGCGKTTTLNMIAGFFQPDDGEIWLNDQNITRLPVHKRKTPMVFQDYALFPHLNVFENIAYGLKQAKKDRRFIKDKVEKILEDLGLPKIIDRFPNQLSGGQQQRIALARALVLEPEILLLDEPLSNLDAKLRIKVRYEIKELRQKFNITTVFVTHDQEEALSISDKIAVMNKGVIEQFGDPGTIYCQPANEFVAGFIGESNFLTGQIIQSVSDGAETRVQFGWNGQVFEVPCKQRDIRVGEQRKLLLRPEAISLYRPDQVTGSEGYIPGIIKRSSFLGNIMRYWIETAGQEMVVDDAKLIDHGSFYGEVLMSFKDHTVHFL